MLQLKISQPKGAQMKLSMNAMHLACAIYKYTAVRLMMNVEGLYGSKKKIHLHFLRQQVILKIKYQYIVIILYSTSIL